jgi:hypothetical protein
VSAENGNSNAAFLELRTLYTQLGSELEPFRRHCDTRGTCCNFTKTGHKLYVTTLEAAEMARAGVAADETQAAEGICPFLRGKLCGVREHRALGCRIYYCDRTYEENRNEVYERFLKRVREIEARYGIEHSYRSVTEIDFSAIKPA